MSDIEGEPSTEELAEEAADHNRDRTTRREALELDLEDRGRSEEGEDVEIEQHEPHDPNT